jgi:maleate cis-trans isomerase
MAYKSWRGDVGVIKPTMRPGSLEEFIRLLPEGIGVIPLFLDIQRGTLNEFTEAINAYEEKIAKLAELEVDLIHPEGAPPFMIQGFEGERTLTAGWERKYGVPIVTSSQVQVEALQALGLSRIVGATYTAGETNEVIVRYFGEAGIEMVAFEAMTVDFHQVGQISHHDVYSHVKKAVLQHPEAEGVLLFGSGWRSLGAISLLERDLRLPVVHAVTARVWAVQRRLHVREPVSGYGRLLEEMP